MRKVAELGKGNQNIVVNEELVKNGVVNEKFVKNLVMNAQTDPKVVMDLSTFRIGVWNSVEPSERIIY